ncbi:hypothetical protein KIN20_003406 [Parelaphostrongylus tenuis]|uniref:Uncharacterized protein n=1 Tax=Parelaphostrongylus tenuis TaxID=148309 RepID=A0AAD5QDP7_PARTN|nr:hypothetical protein KIN20_003406 [Parelaphostrongylus tenuis]
MSELSEKILKSKSENSNPQMVRLKMLKKIISNFTPSELSLSGEEIREPKKPVVVENEPDQTEVTPPELSAT